MSELKNLREWFNDEIVKQTVCIAGISRLAKISNSTLSAFVRGEQYRYLTQEQIDKVVSVVVQLGYKPVISSTNNLL